MKFCSIRRKTALLRATTSIFPMSVKNGGRFRVNVFRKQTGVGAVFRFIPAEIPTLEKLELPEIVERFCDYHQGMVLVTGSTGTGKSTTLAAMIDHLNRTRSLNIISLEDPIEFVHPSKRSRSSSASWDARPEFRRRCPRRNAPGPGCHSGW